MISIFSVTEDLKISHKDMQVVYDLHKQANPDRTTMADLYFSTPSALSQRIMQLGTRANDIFKHFDLEAVKHQLPPDITFSKPGSVVPKGPEWKVAIINPMMNGLGDHLMWLRAFACWHEEMQRIMPSTKIVANLFPPRIGGCRPIITQWESLFNQIYLLPAHLSDLQKHDAYIDLGSIILREELSQEPMVDVLLKSFGLDPEKVPPDKKRIRYSIPEASGKLLDQVINTIKFHERPILLFHSKSTSPIRSISDAQARRYISEIIKRTDYVVVSAEFLDYRHSRFVDISPYTKGSLDNFAALVSRVDAIISVDTVTYHLADAFNIPAVALFTSIEPSNRIKYYPFVKGIMLEEPGGLLYGKHKESADPELFDREIRYVDALWSKLDIDSILTQLRS